MYQEATKDPHEANLTDRQKTIIRWIDAYCVDAANAPDDLLEAMTSLLTQEELLECAVYSLIGLCFSKLMIVVGAEIGAGDTVGHGPDRDIDPYVNSIEVAYTAGKSSWNDLAAEGNFGHAGRIVAPGETASNLA